MIIVYRERPTKPCEHPDAFVDECVNGVDSMVCPECEAEWDRPCLLYEVEGGEFVGVS